MFWSRITTSHGIAVKWYLRVYWLLPLSIVASFKKNRRFFCLAPTILLPSTDDSFGKHRRLFCWAPWILGPVNQLHFQKESFPAFNGLFFSSSTTNSRQLGSSHTESTDTCQQDPSVFVDTTVISDMLNSSDWLGRTKIGTCSLGGQVSMKRSLSLGLHLRRRETITESTLPSLSALLKIYWALFVE